jgi:protein associated with RNAse G/E
MDEYEQNSNEMKYPEKIKEKIIKVKEKVKNLIEIGFFNKHIEKYKDFFKISNEN